MKKKPPVKNASKEIEDQEHLIASLYDERDSIYRKIQDMTVDFAKTDSAMKIMASLNTEIKRAQTKLKNLQNS